MPVKIASESHDYKAIATYGAAKIKDGMTIFVHCYSQSVLAVLTEAKRQGKEFTVRLNEIRPNFTGRMMARALAKKKIPVILTVDLGGLFQLQHADFFLCGADAITPKGDVVNKFGTEMLVRLASELKIPVYVCAHTSKFDVSLKKLSTKSGVRARLLKILGSRPLKEVWARPPKGVTLLNPAYDLTEAKYVTGFITEKDVRKTFL